MPTNHDEYQVITHKNDVWWYEAPIPRRFHRCTAWTQAWHGPYGLRYTERCACGAIRFSTHDGWEDRNARRKGR